MHSSRMRTARSLTASRSIHGVGACMAGDICGGGGIACPRGSVHGWAAWWVHAGGGGHAWQRSSAWHGCPPPPWTEWQMRAVKILVRSKKIGSVWTMMCFFLSSCAHGYIGDNETHLRGQSVSLSPSTNGPIRQNFEIDVWRSCSVFEITAWW